MKIVVLGPESTGKSSLCKQLAEYFKTNWVPEYARLFLEKNGTDYSYEDLLLIAQGQIILEDEIALTTDNDTLIIDTDLHVMKVWCEFVFGKCHQWILDNLEHRKYDLYLLCKNDLPWVKDNLREYPDDKTREKLFRIYENLMIGQNVPYVIVVGNYAERFNIAVKAIKDRATTINV